MTEDIKHKEFYNLAIAYLAGEAGDEEVKQLEDLIKNDSEKSVVFREIKKTWQLTNSQSLVFNEEESWKKISNAIEKNEESEINYPFAEEPSRRKFFIRIAAIVILLISAGSILYLQLKPFSSNEFLATTEILEERLDDGSAVTLNNRSRLTWNKQFNKKERRVQLEGSAFFDVQRDKEKPFIVESSGATVTVLGTSFLINARENKNTLEVIVSTGKVKVSTSADDQVELEAGEKALFNKRLGSLEKQLNQDMNYLAWKTKKLVFENTPLPEVIQSINEAYQVEVRLSSPQLDSCYLTATYVEYPVKDVLVLIAETLDLSLSGTGTDGKFALDGPGCN